MRGLFLTILISLVAWGCGAGELFGSGDDSYMCPECHKPVVIAGHRPSYFEISVDASDSLKMAKVSICDCQELPTDSVGAKKLKCLFNLRYDGDSVLFL